jgi:hypothetical protein
VIAELVKPEKREVNQDTIMVMARERLKKFRDAKQVQLPSLIAGGDNRQLILHSGP